MLSFSFSGWAFCLDVCVSQNLSIVTWLQKFSLFHIYCAGAAHSDHHDSFFGSVAGRKNRKPEYRGFLSQKFIDNFNRTKFATFEVLHGSYVAWQEQ